MNSELKDILKGFKRSLRLIDHSEQLLLILATIIMLFTGILTNLPAVILGRLVDKLVSPNDFQFSLAIPFISSIIVIIIIRETLTVLRKYLVENIATQTEKKQTVSVINHLLKTDIATIQQQQIGSLHGKIFRSIQGLVQMIKLTFLDFFPAFFGAFAAIGIALTQKPLMASIMILVIPTGLFIIIKQISSQKGIRIALLRGKEDIDGKVVEMLGGIETVRVLDTINLEVAKVEMVAETLRAREIKHHIYMALFDAGKYLNEGFFYILVICLAIILSAQGIITRGDILVYSVLYLSITNPLREIHRILDQAHESSILVNDLYTLKNEPLDQSFDSKPATPTPNNSQAVITLHNLSFAYSDHPNVPVLKSLNLTIKPGEKIGIAGASGCGKSTLIKILLRLTHDYTGQVSLFNQDLKTLSRPQIAEKIAYVPQKTYLFSGTIRENISYGYPTQLTDDQIIEAARKANIYPEINQSLGGLKGRVEENGNNLSGGQKQRIALARLMLKNPELIILDEATSALDNTNEAKVQKNLEANFAGKTVITIAHRLTTLKNCDRILVFDQGKIVQEGSYSNLAKTAGLFQDFLNQNSL